jgi:hypothetical protein
MIVSLRQRFAAMRIEHWIYVLAGVIAITTIVLVNVVKAPLQFGIW